MIWYFHSTFSLDIKNLKLKINELQASVTDMNENALNHTKRHFEDIEKLEHKVKMLETIKVNLEQKMLETTRKMSDVEKGIFVFFLV